MARTLLAVIVCLMSAPAFAAGPQGVEALMRHYDAGDLAEGRIQVSGSGDVVYVSGMTPAGPWLDVWRRTEGEWRKTAKAAMTELTPIRFGAKRHRPCRGTS